MGEISGDTYFFFEDYAYTYLKKHTEILMPSEGLRAFHTCG
jgi:hypothetical protein